MNGVIISNCYATIAKINLKEQKMKKLNLMAMLLGAALFAGIGAVSLSANDKCGAGKCGSEMKEPASKCGEAKCGDEKEAPEKKCGDSKCGDEKEAPEKKCGDSKCGDEK